MEITFAPKAKRQLAKLPRGTQKRIAEKMRFYAKQENPLRFAEHLTDHKEGDFRFRIGDCRIAFDVKKDVIHVLKIKRRSKAYK
jgi:mRNA interferase RelE/StbE